MESLEIHSTLDAYTHFKLLACREEERLEVICLNVGNRVIAHEEVFRGGLSGMYAHPREILRLALHKNAAKILVAHNHPSQDPSPSLADLTFTKRLRAACRAIGIELLDHLIVCEEGKFFSFRRSWRSNLSARPVSHSQLPAVQPPFDR